MYSGYANWETWNVNLWLSNDHGEYLFWSERARELLDDNDGDKDDAATDLGNEIETSLTEFMPTVTGVYADLLNSALGEVDWREIADTWVEDVYDEWEEDNKEDEDEDE